MTCPLATQRAFFMCLLSILHLQGWRQLLVSWFSGDLDVTTATAVLKRSFLVWKLWFSISADFHISVARDHFLCLDACAPCGFHQWMSFLLICMVSIHFVSFMFCMYCASTNISKPEQFKADWVWRLRQQVSVRIVSDLSLATISCRATHVHRDIQLFDQHGWSLSNWRVQLPFSGPETSWDGSVTGS